MAPMGKILISLMMKKLQGKLPRLLYVAFYSGSGGQAGKEIDCYLIKCRLFLSRRKMSVFSSGNRLWNPSVGEIFLRRNMRGILKIIILSQVRMFFIWVVLYRAKSESTYMFYSSVEIKSVLGDQKLLHVDFFILLEISIVLMMLSIWNLSRTSLLLFLLYRVFLNWQISRIIGKKILKTNVLFSRCKVLKFVFFSSIFS